MRKTIEFFETKGLVRLREDDHAAEWYEDFVDFVKRERIFATLCTPAGIWRERHPMGYLAKRRVR